LVAAGTFSGVRWHMSSHENHLLKDMYSASGYPNLSAWCSCLSTAAPVLHAQIARPSSDAICLAGAGTTNWCGQYNAVNHREAHRVLIATVLVVHIYARQSRCSVEPERASRETRSTWHLLAPTTPPPSVKGGARPRCRPASAATRCDDHLHGCVRCASVIIVECVARCPPVARAP
jgi:hypothetical protein